MNKIKKKVSRIQKALNREYMKILANDEIESELNGLQKIIVIKM